MLCCVVADFFKWNMMPFEYGLRLSSSLKNVFDHICTSCRYIETYKFSGVFSCICVGRVV